MSITIDFILLFILVVIPGLIFKRFYFLGEFSKQFSTKDSVYKSIFYSIVPGVLIQVFGYWIYSLSRTPNFGNKELFSIFNEIFLSTHNYSSITGNFVDNEIQYFLLHEFNVFVLAAFLGFLCYTLIRIFKLDIRFKILRFKNQWYYVFSGEIRAFKKFKNVSSILIDSTVEDNEYKYFPPKIDVLVEGEGKPVLYSGYLIDYDLDYENINNLEKIYLLGAHKFRTLHKDEDPTDLIIEGSRVKVPIKGDLFILKGDKILNMNLTFIPSPELHKGRIEKKKKFDLNNFILHTIYYTGSTINILIFIYLAFINLSFLKDIFPSITDFVKDFNWFDRVLLASVINVGLSLLMPAREENKSRKSKTKGSAENKAKPVKLEKGKLEYESDLFIGKIVILIILAVLHYFISY